ncbi:alanine racemase [Patescibacteria group bacterium]|nr:alanine racemase [Patescibacteria group bacterium]MBU0964371.1 alanine racemase [Patescibacteria group bacterium]
MKNDSITWLEISSLALKHNIKQFIDNIPKSSKIMAVVKSNAYGHGLNESARIFKQAGCHWLGTVNLDEALILRKNGIKGRILVLSFYNPNRLVEAVKQGITLTSYSLKSAQRLSKIGKKLNRIIKIHFKIDTGTSRLGLSPENAIVVLKKISKLDNIIVEGIFTHFADAENPNQSFTNKQIRVFNQLTNNLEKQGINIPIKHLACSASTILNSRSILNLVRIGISAYGLWSVENDSINYSELRNKFNLKPALSWYTKIIQIKNINRGRSVGYGRSFKAKQNLKIALIPVGYWDGYDRKLSNIGEVLISGKRCRVIGRICMNLCIIDIGRLKNVRTGDKVTLIGTDGKNTITADELADKINTINYEIVTRINPNLPRIIIN